jgi:hypothetical protein
VFNAPAHIITSWHQITSFSIDIWLVNSETEHGIMRHKGKALEIITLGCSDAYVRDSMKNCQTLFHIYCLPPRLSPLPVEYKQRSETCFNARYVCVVARLLRALHNAARTKCHNSRH